MEVKKILKPSVNVNKTELQQVYKYRYIVVKFVLHLIFFKQDML